MKKRLAPILSAALLLVCLIYPIILQKPTGKGEEISLYEAILKDLDEQFGIDSRDIVWEGGLTADKKTMESEGGYLPYLYRPTLTESHMIITDYLTDNFGVIAARPVKIIRLGDVFSQKRLSPITFMGSYGEIKMLDGVNYEVMFKITVEPLEDFSAAVIDYENLGRHYTVQYDFVK